MTPESKVKFNIKKVLKEHSVYYAMPHGAGYGNAGVPDFLCCMNGRFIAVEAKSGKNVPTALQHKAMNEIMQAGGTTWVVNEDNLHLFVLFVKANAHG
jgi:hypothetical protein